jgi:hypothetical protein
VSYHRLSEGARSLITDYIKANINAELNTVGAAVGAPQMSLENPASYFIYEKPHGYSLPAVYVIVDGFNFRQAEKKANCINAKARINVSVEVEDQDAEILTYKADRYMSALHQILEQADIAEGDGSLKLKVIVVAASFSPKYMAPEGSGAGGKFRKEIMLQCEVEHIENL